MAKGREEKKRRRRSSSAFCLMFISRELHSGTAHNDVISLNSLSGLFTLRGRAKESGRQRREGVVCVCVCGGGFFSRNTQPHLPYSSQSFRAIRF